MATIPAAAPAVRKVLRVTVKFVLQFMESYYDPPVGSMNSGSRPARSAHPWFIPAHHQEQRLTSSSGGTASAAHSSPFVVPPVEDEK
jgi:hypothetical protein